MKKIVILDGFTTNPGDLSWEKLESLGDVTVYDRTAPDEVISRSKNAEMLIVNKVLMTAEVMAQLPSLQYIGLTSTGTNVVDLPYAKEHGIVVTNVPAYSSDSVAQLVFAMMLEHFIKVQRQSDSVYAGDWVNSVDFSYYNSTLIEAAGKVMGIIGFGEIGMRVAKIANAFGMSVLINSRTKKDLSMLENAEWVSQEEVFKKSDVLSIHCPLTDETGGLINKDNLSLMKKTAILINLSRGGVVVEQDLADALNADQIAGAALDVLSTEPPKSDNPMLSAKNCIITPHTAWATYEARERLVGVVVENVKAYLDGTPINNVTV
jgi:glycerate dehydrogenase